MSLDHTPSPCPRLASAPEGWPAIDAAFAGLPALPFGQAWLGELEPRFRPASARFAWREGCLCVKVDLQDDDVFNPVTRFNEPAFLKGDVVEIFALAPGGRHYCEVHSTPGATVYQVRFLTERPRESLAFIASPAARAVTRKTGEGWSAYLEMPFELAEAAPAPGQQWRVAVCRYDYTRGQPQPVLSSTAPLTEPNFHQLERWNRIVFA